MKILQIAPLWASVPPKKYGGAELIVSNLCEELYRRGHRVTLYASGDSQTKAELVTVVKESLGQKVKLGEIGADEVIKSELMSNFLAFLEAEKFDIVHSHSSFLGAAYANFINKPCVITLHAYPKESELIIMEKSKAKFISISNSYKKVVSSLGYIDTVYNGSDIAQYKFDNKGGEDLVAIGRMSAKKGLGEAVKVAIEANVGLRIAGPAPKLSDGNKNKDWLVDEKYFKEEINPYIGKGKINHVGEISDGQKSDFFKAKATLFPISWEEPFGLVMTESMACGTPVIAFAMGSVPEIIKDGKTGYIVNISEDNKRGDWIIKRTGVEGLVEAVRVIKDLPEKKYIEMRQNCRRHVEENFTIEKMVDGYEEVYKKVIQDFGKPTH
jgi:glycosyltransferase involved in cell wall biosynthesis